MQLPSLAPAQPAFRAPRRERETSRRRTRPSLSLPRLAFRFPPSAFRFPLSAVQACLCLAAAVPFVAAGAGPNDFSPANLPRPDTWVVDGPVYVMLEHQGAVYLGGSFNSVRPPRGTGVALDLTSLQPQQDFPQVTGTLLAVASDQAGGFYLGGTFTQVGGLPRTNLAYIRPDRRVAAWAPATDAAVTALAWANGVVYAGGDFTTIQGQSRTRLAALDGATGGVTAWNPAASNRVTEVVVARNTVYVAGLFVSISGQPRAGVAAIDSEGAGQLLPWNPAPIGSVRALAVAGDVVYAGGTFTNIAGLPRDKLAALDANTGQVTPWVASTNSSITSIEALAISGTTLYVGGSFTRLGGAERNSLAALDAATGAATVWNPNPAGALNTTVNAIAATENLLLVGGNFSTITGQPRAGFAALDARTGTVLPWALEFMGAARRIAISFRTVFAAGPTSSRGALVRRSAAALDLATGQPTGWNPDVTGSVWALLADGAGVYVGGSFFALGGEPVFNMALVDATNGIRIANWNHEADGPVFALARTGDGRIVAGGGFGSIDFVDRPFLAAFLASGALTSWNPQPDGAVYALGVSGNTAYAAGDFQHIGGEQRRFLAALDVEQGVVPGWTPNPDAAVISLLVTGATVYASGNFTNIGGQVRRGVVALDATNGAATAWNASVNGGVGGLGLAQGTLFLGGNFSSVGSLARRNLASVSASNGSVLPWDPSPDSIVSRLLIAQNAIFISGAFGVTAYAPADAPRLLTSPAHQSVAAGSPATFSVIAQGAPGPSYQWRFNGINIPGATLSNLTVASAHPSSAGAYSVVVSNSAGRVASPDAILTVLTAPEILSHSGSRTVAPGSAVTFSVAATGHPLHYTWSLNGTPIPGAMGPTLSLPSVQPAHSGEYRVTVFNETAFAESLPASLAVTASFFPFSDQFATRLSLPQSLSGVCSGDNFNATNEPAEPNHAGLPGGRSVWCEWTAPQTGVATFSTEGSSFDTLLAIYASDSNNTNLTVLADDDDQGGYGTSRVLVPVLANTTYSIAIDGLGGETGRIVLSWNLVPGTAAVPRILTQPRSVAVPRGTNVTLSVLATNLGSGIPNGVTYQWQHGDRSIPGATSATLTLTAVRERDLGRYQATLANSAAIRLLTSPAELVLGDFSPFAGPRKRHIITALKLGDILKPRTFVPADVSGGFLPATQGASATNSVELDSSRRSQPLAGGCYYTVNPCLQRVQCPKPWLVTNDFPVPVVVFVEGSGIANVVGIYTGPPDNILQHIIPGACDVSTTSAAGVPDYDTHVTFTAEPGHIYGIVAASLNDQPGQLTVRITVCPPPAALAPAGGFVRFEGSRALLSVMPGLAACGFGYQWRSNGVVIDGARAHTLERPYPLQPASYSIVLSNCAGLTTTSVVDFVQLQLDNVFKSLIATGSSWHYHDSGAISDTTWRSVSFNDSPWSAGRAPLGYGTADGRVAQTTNGYGADPTRRHITTYYRQRFVVASPAAYASLRLSLQCDDGAIVYLNGNEVFRANLPNGQIDPLSTATLPIEGTEETQWRTTTFASTQLAITNVLAVEVHQHSASSDDLWLELELTGQPAPSQAPFPFDETATHWYYLSRSPAGSNPVIIEFGTAGQPFPAWGGFECPLPTTIFEPTGEALHRSTLFQAWPLD